MKNRDGERAAVCLAPATKFAGGLDSATACLRVASYRARREPKGPGGPELDAPAAIATTAFRKALNKFGSHIGQGVCSEAPLPLLSTYFESADRILVLVALGERNLRRTLGRPTDVALHALWNLPALVGAANLDLNLLPPL